MNKDDNQKNYEDRAQEYNRQIWRNTAVENRYNELKNIMSPIEAMKQAAKEFS